MEFNGVNGDISPTIHCSRPEFQVFGKKTLWLLRLSSHLLYFLRDIRRLFSYSHSQSPLLHRNLTHLAGCFSFTLLFVPRCAAYNHDEYRSCLVYELIEYFELVVFSLSKYDCFVGYRVSFMVDS